VGGSARAESISGVFDVRRLAVLQEVIRCGSLSAAAASLNYTTSAVSQQISALERDVGSTLLVRSPTGVRPTAAGTRLLEHADVILGAVAAAERDLTLLATARPGVVRVASFASAAAAILPLAFARFRTLCPDIDLDLVSADPEEGVAMLSSDGVDAAVITEVPGEDAEFSGLHTMPVYDDEFFVVLPARHRLAAAAEVPFAALAAEQWVVSTETGTCPDVRVFQQACRRSGSHSIGHLPRRGLSDGAGSGGRESRCVTCAFACSGRCPRRRRGAAGGRPAPDPAHIDGDGRSAGGRDTVGDVSFACAGRRCAPARRSGLQRS
jgi:DNA-binding transcriptional LysR family regulator